ncbi:MAG: PHP domain-containing protein [Candidatus Helarchaeota archaeon]|nr:PHP domain-containing protein [Candidatus Helarchaeota archaeon]
MVLFDFHIHSEWSDGDNSLEEIMKAAKDKGLEIIGINDHLSSIKATIPLESEALQDYLLDIREISQKLGIKTLAGLEIDIFPPDQLDIVVLNKFDYLIFENIMGLPKIKAICEFSKKIKGPLVGLAHTELRYPDPIFRKIIKLLEDNKIFIELNANYTQNYEASQDLFKLIAESKIGLSIGSDSHSIKTLGLFNYAIEFLDNFDINLEERLVLLKNFKSGL